MEDTVTRIASVIVPTLRRPGPLSRCLESLTALRIEGEAPEVVVAADRADAETARVVAAFERRLDVRIVAPGRRGPAAARNAAAGKARGAVLAFTDDDCAPAGDWLAVLVARLQAAPGSVVGGRTVNGLDNPFSAASQTVIDALYRHYNDSGGPARFFTTNNLALERETFESLGGFDETFPFAGGEDRDFCDRCLERGIALLFEPDALVVHCHDLTSRTLWRQHFTYGRGAAYLGRARARRGRDRAEIPWRLYPVLLRQAVGSNGATVGRTAMVTLTQAAYAAGLGYERLRGSLRRGSS